MKALTSKPLKTITSFKKKTITAIHVYVYLVYIDFSWAF